LVDCFFAVLTLVLGASAAPSQTSPAKKKVLVVWGGDMHEPKQCVDLFVPWLMEQGFEVEVSPTLDSYLDAEKMKALSLIVQSITVGNITAQQERGLLNAVKSGVGMAGWHGGLADSFRGNTEYEFMVGGIWVAHPGNVFEYEVNITNHDDPITKGLTDFRVRSEQYYLLVDPNVEVLATTTFSGKGAPWIKSGVMPVVWKKLYGQGRIFYFSVGHAASDFSVFGRTTVRYGFRMADTRVTAGLQKLCRFFRGQGHRLRSAELGSGLPGRRAPGGIRPDWRQNFAI
jgi:type 1 glutamine amidotransferase